MWADETEGVDAISEEWGSYRSSGLERQRAPFKAEGPSRVGNGDETSDPPTLREASAMGRKQTASAKQGE